MLSESMLAPPHPARTMPFDVLHDGLHDALRRRMAVRVEDGSGLSLWVYTRRCVYERAWDGFTLLARGLVTDDVGRRVVATPFPKIFNLGEPGAEVPPLPFEAFEKLDGSLISVFWHGGRWRTASKGAFASPQAIWAQSRIDGMDLSALSRTATYLFEAVYPENRVVIRYDDAALVLLAAYAGDGMEMPREEVRRSAAQAGFRLEASRGFTDIDQMLSTAAALPDSCEGFVLRFANGVRIKIKGAAYRRIHALLARVTPLTIWTLMRDGGDPEAMRRELPEEFWEDFDGIAGALEARLRAVEQRAAEAAASVAHLSDRELGLAIPRLPEAIRPFIFTLRRGEDLRNSRSRAALYRQIRPDRDMLEGYTPSWAVQRFTEEAG